MPSQFDRLALSEAKCARLTAFWRSDHLAGATWLRTHLNDAVIGHEVLEGGRHIPAFCPHHEYANDMAMGDDDNEFAGVCGDGAVKGLVDTL